MAGGGDEGLRRHQPVPVGARRALDGAGLDFILVAQESRAAFLS
jgi:hypothetical protein